ncbi:MAG: hypothetical protein IJ144_06870 [Prevotella sp.]|nr:hypothetical protein [Prevotella sp.]
MSKLINLTFGIRPQAGANFDSVKTTGNMPQAVAQISISQQLADQLELLPSHQQLVDDFESRIVLQLVEQFGPKLRPNNTRSTIFQTLFGKSLEHETSETLLRNSSSPLTIFKNLRHRLRNSTLLR